MKRDRDLEWRGFQLLVQREDGFRFFDALLAAGFFDPQRNPAPTREEGNTVGIALWPPLGYLKSIAEHSGEQDDVALANKVIGVVRAVAAWRDEKGEVRSNYRTNWAFAEILGLVPTHVVTMADIDLLEGWLKDPYDRMMVPSPLDQGALPRFLESKSSEDWKKAARILFYSTAIVWRQDGERDSSPFSLVDDFSLGEIISHHAKRIGRQAREAAAEDMLGRVREVFSKSLRREHSSSYRPAVEQNAQNYRSRSAENRVVEALRDVVLGWCDGDADAARAFVEGMLRDDVQMVRRVGIYILGQQWQRMSHLYEEIVGPGMFDGQSHEIYQLLQDHFAEMSPERQAATFESIKNLPRFEYSSDPEGSRRHGQYRWLSAIKEKGYGPADALFFELGRDPRIGGLGEHPEFDSYISGGWVGPESSLYSSEELIAMAQEGTLAGALNAFVPTNDWRMPTGDGVAAALESATRDKPDIFLPFLLEFSTKPMFQQAIVDGLRGAWEAKVGANWEHVVGVLGVLCNDQSYWRAESNVERNRVAAAIADLLGAGNKDDRYAYDASLLPRTRAILARLIEEQAGSDKPSDDAVFQAINTPKGRVIEALYIHTLREARIADKQEHTHGDVWRAICPLFEEQLAKCKGANYEFSTFAGMYLAQLQYLDSEWANKWVEQIFPSAYETNAVCAFDGLAYASFTGGVYSLLSKHGLIERGLSMQLKGRSARAKLLERIAAAYLWGFEELDGAPFARLFATASVEDLEVMGRVFWMIRGEPKLSAEKKRRILSFWIHCLDWADRQEQPPSGLLATLALLTVYIIELGAIERRLLEGVAPHIHYGHGLHEFAVELNRLVAQDPAEIMKIFELMINAHPPEYDYEGRLLALIKSLVANGQKERVVLNSNQLRAVQGFPEFFRTLQTSS